MPTNSELPLINLSTLASFLTASLTPLRRGFCFSAAPRVPRRRAFVAGSLRFSAASSGESGPTQPQVVQELFDLNLIESFAASAEPWMGNRSARQKQTPRWAGRLHQTSELLG